VNAALPLTKKKGHFVQVGIFAERFNALDQESIVQREIEYIGCRSQKPSSWRTGLELLEAGKIDADKLITKVVSLEDWREGFDAVMSGEELKVLVKS
jgi:L-iditol 2-dehydrogenase